MTVVHHDQSFVIEAFTIPFLGNSRSPKQWQQLFDHEYPYSSPVMDDQFLAHLKTARMAHGRENVRVIEVTRKVIVSSV